MFTLKIEALGSGIITLTGDETRYQIVDIDGLNPPKAIINSAIIPGMDGSKFSSSRLQERNIVITIKINGEVERNRINLYRFFRTKQWCKVYYTNDMRDVSIEGYVESVDCNLFQASEIMQISIVCQDPYFKSALEIVDDVSKVLNEFTFPFTLGDNGATYDGTTINSSTMDDAKEFSTYNYEKITEVVNGSESEVGLIIQMNFSGTVVDPKIINVTTGETFKILGTYEKGDEIIINTNKGKKSIKLYRNGNETNIFNKMARDSTWFSLSVGLNYFSYVATRGDTHIKLLYRHSDLYEGV